MKITSRKSAGKRDQSVTADRERLAWDLAATDRAITVLKEHEDQKIQDIKKLLDMKAVFAKEMTDMLRAITYVVQDINGNVHAVSKEEHDKIYDAARAANRKESGG